MEYSPADPYQHLIEEAKKLCKSGKNACPNDVISHGNPPYVRAVYIELNAKVQRLIETMDKQPTSALLSEEFRHAYADLQRISGRVNKILHHMHEAYSAFSIAFDFGKSPIYRIHTSLAAAQCLREETNCPTTHSHVAMETWFKNVFELLEGLGDEEIHSTLVLAYYYGPFSKESFTNARLIMETENGGAFPYEAEILEAVLYARLGLKEVAYQIWKSILGRFPPRRYPKTTAYMQNLLR
ncbi:hypothetical protein COW46_03875 [Candidatus Gracilibacteria bacterium CG17_big_fil_post_rev_8_21_14_2_50_48_13]|nr:MAG: hypothetical protein COW46_03875 [Candidatus Gracilibacteria bacterium CG17_big_fil_post_rev_8_21_14_2_50_48_13]